MPARIRKYKNRKRGTELTYGVISIDELKKIFPEKGLRDTKGNELREKLI